MKNSQLTEDAQAVVVCAEDRRCSAKAGRVVRRRLENSRRKLVRSIVRVCHTLSDDKICRIAEYILRIAE